MSLSNTEIITLQEQLQKLPHPIAFIHAHGFITAVACSPNPPSPNHWLPYLLTQAKAEHDETARSLLRLYTDITHRLYAGQTIFPVLVTHEPQVQTWQAQDNYQNWQAWCIAYLSWVGINKDWSHHHDHKQIDNLLYPILTLASTHEQYNKAQAKKTSLEEFQTSCQKYHEQLPTLIQRIYYYWQNHAGCFHHHQQTTTTTTQTKQKVGRNDSCPCGSGKKYKRCCDLALSH